MKKIHNCKYKTLYLLTRLDECYTQRTNIHSFKVYYHLNQCVKQVHGDLRTITLQTLYLKPLIYLNIRLLMHQEAKYT